MSAAKKAPLATWEYCDDKHKWHALRTATVATVVEPAFIAWRNKTPGALASATFTDYSQTYQVSFPAMTQTNTATGKVRPLRRLRASDGHLTDGRVAEWRWAKGEGSAATTAASDYAAFSVEHSMMIERGFVGDELCVVVPISVSAHDMIPMQVHLGRMVQINPVSGRTRAVRREEVVLHDAAPHISAKPATAAKAASAPSAGTAVASVPVPAAAVTTMPVAAAPARRARSPVDVAPSASPAGHAAAGDAVSGGTWNYDRMSPTSDSAIAEGAALVAQRRARAVMGSVAISDWQCTASNVLVLRVTPAKGVVPSFPVKIAAFDLDDTLITPQGHHVFATSASDWKWLHESVPAKLRALHDEGYHLLIVSNQGGSTGSDDTKALQLQDKIIKMGVALGLPLSAMLALDKASAMRKPSSAMWRLWASVLHHERVSASTPAGAALPPASEVTLSGLISVTESFYVGDAAGRLPTPAGTMAGRKKDFSCGDRKFAYNCGLKFYTPEEFYLGHRPTDFTWDGFGPAELLALKRAVVPPGNFGLPAKGPEMVLMVGFPGSGKSTFYRNFLASRHYQSVNRDTLKSTDKCLAAAEAALAAGKCVCVDNTNAGPADRAPFIALAKKYRVPARVFVMTAAEGLAQRMNRLRAALGISPAVPAIAYRMMQGKLKERPDATAEGLAEVVDVPVVPNFAGLPPLAQRLFFEL